MWDEGLPVVQFGALVFGVLKCALESLLKPTATFKSVLVGFVRYSDFDRFYILTCRDVQ